ncbi:MAG TPA: chemotaxis response regulator protein-glutamate methylesterase [Candidatus Acidoferrum sp.]|jgi:two-component system chemotaxis response regulator CheB|nr:chemotaxis response regulator protein-glutamate methylesterase [Candidatus Acidoferrum sp.]
MSATIKVLVVDDSALMRKLIPAILARDPSIDVVGTAMDGAFALKKIEELRPDVVTLDLEMPRMDGMETLRMIMRRTPMPVVLFSTHSKEGAYATLKALALGAIDFVAKPQEAAAGHLDSIADQLIEKIKVAKRAAGRKLPAAVVSDDPPQRKKKSARSALPPNRVIVIGISTGGPNALQYVLSQIPADFPASFVVVQHMPEGFTEMFARRLDECCALEVHEARSGDLLVAGRVLICPGNRHIMVRRMPRGDMAVLSDGPPVNGHRPSADVLFHSAAQHFGLTAVGLLMTGMGEDGAEGLGALKAAGGMTIAQSEDTCVVSGMPRAAISKGYANKVIPLDGLPHFLLQSYGGDRSGADKFDKNEKNDKNDKNEKSERTPVSSHRT